MDNKRLVGQLKELQGVATGIALEQLTASIEDLTNAVDSLEKGLFSGISGEEFAELMEEVLYALAEMVTKTEPTIRIKGTEITFSPNFGVDEDLERIVFLVTTFGEMFPMVYIKEGSEEASDFANGFLSAFAEQMSNITKRLLKFIENEVEEIRR